MWWCMAQVLGRYLWSLVSRWLKAICQFDPPFETMVMVIYKARLDYVATIWPNQCKLAQKPKRVIYRYTVEDWQIHNSVFFLISCKSIPDWRNLWVQLSFEVVCCTFTLPLHSPQQCMSFFLCASFAVTWGTHKVAFACCVTRGCKIPRRKCTCIC